MLQLGLEDCKALSFCREGARLRVWGLDVQDMWLDGSRVQNTIIL